MSEMAEYKYHARDLQVKAMNEKALASAIQELSELPPTIVKLKIVNNLVEIPHDVSIEKLLSDAAEANKLGVRTTLLIGILKELQEACSSSRSGLKHISLERKASVLLPIETLFRGVQGPENLLNSSTERGVNEAFSLLSTILETEFPIMPYRLDLIQNKINLVPDLSRGLIGFIPTNIPNVDYKLWYPKKVVHPQSSLVIKIFED